MRRRIVLAATVGALTLAFAAPPAGAYEAPVDAYQVAENPSSVPSASGIDASERQILSGLLFGVGDFAAEIGTEITQFRGITKEEYQNQAAVVLAAFIDAHVIELESVLADLRSGDINRVETGLRDLGTLYAGYLETLVTPEEQAAALQRQAPPQVACGFAIACVFYAALAVHNTIVVTAAVAGALSVALAIAVTVTCGVTDEGCSPTGSTSSTRAEREYFVATVARAAQA